MREIISEVAIVGTGLVGCGWAVAFALGGANVRLYDSVAAQQDGALARASQMLADMAAYGLADDAARALSRMRVVDTLAGALDGADYVQESVFETVEAKSAVAREIGALISSGVVVGSSSSGFPASRFTAEAENRNRFLIAHPVNPPHLVPVVELVPAPWTDTEIVPWLRRNLERIGKVPVALSREIDGFILNRLQWALVNEAWALFDEGLASAPDIDATVSHGLGLRWAFMGPFETIDLNAPGGVADYAARFGGNIHRIMSERGAPKAWTRDLVDRVTAERRSALPLDDLAERSAWRDRRLMALTAHLAQQRQQNERL